MSRLVIFDVGPDAPWHRPTALLQELAVTPDLDFTFTTDPALFEAAAAGATHSRALALVHAPPSERVASAIAEVAMQIPTAVLLHSPTRETLRALFDLGVTEVFAEPIAPRRLLSALAHPRKSGSHNVYYGSHGPISGAALHLVEPVGCTVRILGGADLPGHWCAVSGGSFEVSVSHRVADGTLVEILGVPDAVHSLSGVFGRVAHVDTSSGAAVRLRCEALPVSDHAPLWVEDLHPRASVSRPVRPSQALPSAQPRVAVDPALLAGLVLVVLLLAGLGWMAVRQDSPEAKQPATTRQVLDGIERAFE